MNLATKAPNFTRENAAEMARRATRSRMARLAREKAEHEAALRAAAPVTDDARRQNVQCQIDRLLEDMAKATTTKERLALVAAIARLWPLASPTAGVLKPARQHREVMRQL